MKLLHILMMLAGVAVLVYALIPHPRRRREFDLSSTQIAQVLAKKERKSNE